MTEAAVQEYKESIKARAEHLLLKEFPVKIILLNNLLQKLNFHQVAISSIHQDVNVPAPRVPDEPRGKRRRADCSLTAVHYANSVFPQVYTLPNGPSPCNRWLCDLVRTVKPHIRQLVEDTNLLKMWIFYLAPKIEDGNDLGTTVQDHTLKEIEYSETKAEEFLEQISAYFVTRAKIVSKVIKYPHIDDYRKAVRELDEKQYMLLWLNTCEVRNRYCMLHDFVSKNLEKIKRPRSTTVENLY